MGSVIEFKPPKRRREPPRAPAPPPPSRIVTCTQCGERHPVARLPGGEFRCVTAFFDGTNWFCRNRGCRKAWLERQ